MVKLLFWRSRYFYLRNLCWSTLCFRGIPYCKGDIRRNPKIKENRTSVGRGKSEVVGILRFCSEKKFGWVIWDLTLT